MKKTVLCLFFLCLCLISGCDNAEKRTTEYKEAVSKHVANTEENQMTETEETIAEMIVLTDGGKNAEEIGLIICDRMGAVFYDMKMSQKEEMEYMIQNAEYVLIGTENKVEEFEFNIRSMIDEETLADKKTALFLVDREDEEEKFEERVKVWYPDVVLLPLFTINMEEGVRENEMGRMNGWLTSVYTYEIVFDTQ